MVAAALLATAMFGACLPDVAGGPGATPDLHVANGTALPITLVINGTVFDHVAELGSADYPAADLPALPWRIEARSPSGRLLTSVDVAPGQVRETHWPDGRSEYSGALGRVDLSCGRLSIWAGDLTPSGPMPGPGQPGDCAP